MRNIITQISITILLLTSGCTTVPFHHYQHYGGNRMAPTDEATLYIRNLKLDDIRIDGKYVPHMKILKDVQTQAPGRLIVRGLGTRHDGRYGAIKLAPGRHNVFINNCTAHASADIGVGRVRMISYKISGSCKCQLDFEAGKEYNLVVKGKCLSVSRYTTPSGCRIRCENILRH